MKLKKVLFSFLVFLGLNKALFMKTKKVNISLTHPFYKRNVSFDMVICFSRLVPDVSELVIVMFSKDIEGTFINCHKASLLFEDVVKNIAYNLSPSSFGKNDSLYIKHISLADQNVEPLADDEKWSGFKTELEGVLGRSIRAAQNPTNSIFFDLKIPVYSSFGELEQTVDIARRWQLADFFLNAGLSTNREAFVAQRPGFYRFPKFPKPHFPKLGELMLVMNREVE